MIRLSLLFRAFSVVLVLLLKFELGLQPVLRIATVNSATLDVNLERALTDFFGSGYEATEQPT
jgi:hypothetical protein